MLTVICKQTIRYLMPNLSLDLWLCFTHSWVLQDLANLSFIISSFMITEVIPELWKYLGCGPVLTVQCTVLGVTPVRCSTHYRAPVSVLSAWCYNNPLLFPSQVRATWLRVWQFSTSQAVSAAASALPGGEEADWAYCLHTHHDKLQTKLCEGQQGSVLLPGPRRGWWWNCGEWR